MINRFWDFLSGPEHIHPIPEPRRPTSIEVVIQYIGKSKKEKKMEECTYIIMINPLSDVWEIFGESAPRGVLPGVRPTYFDTDEQADSLAKEIALKRGCEVRVVCLLTRSIWKTEPLQVEKKLPSYLSNDIAVEEIIRSEGEPTRRIGNE